MITCTFFITLTLSLAYSKHPGLKTRITQAGLNYADDVAINKLPTSAIGKMIMIQPGRAGGATCEMPYLVIRSFTTSISGIKVTADGLNWNAEAIGLRIIGQYHCTYEITPITEDRGTVDVLLSGVSFSVGVSLRADPTGRPTIASNGCSCNIGSIIVNFYGGTAPAWVYMYFKTAVQIAFRNQLPVKLCSIIEIVVNEDANRALEKLHVTVDIGNKLFLDNRFLATPAFNPNSFLETYHKGEVFWTSSVSEAPFEPFPMPAISSTQKMMYIWVSDYVFNTLTYEAQIHGILVFNLTQKDLPAEAKDFLNTTCKGYACIGSIIPQIGERYPNNQVQMFMSSDFSPKMVASQGKINVLCGGTITMATTRGNEFLLSLNATMQASVFVYVQNENIYSDVGDIWIKLHVMKSNVGGLTDVILDMVGNFTLTEFVKPQLNRLGAKGIPLPVTENVHFVNTEIGVDEDTLMIATDLKYD